MPTLEWTLLLMPWGRVGSNLVLDILSQSGQAVLHNEPFTVIKSERQGEGLAEIGAAQERWIGEHLRETPGGKRLVIKLSADSIADMPGFGSFLRSTAVRLILMDRRNVLATAVSALRAAAFAQQCKEQRGVESWALLKGEEADIIPSVGADELRRAVRRILEQRRNCEALAAMSQNVTRVWYEELVSDVPQQVSRIVAAAGLAPFEFEVRHKKFTAMPLLQSVANPDTLLEVAREFSLQDDLA